MDWNIRSQLRVTHDRIASLRDSQRRLAEDIYNRFYELDMAIDQLQTYFRTDRNCNSSTGKQSRKVKRLRNVKAEDINLINRPLSASVVNYLQNRERGGRKHAADLQFKKSELPDFVSQQVPALLTESEFDLGKINKVFASKWLNDSQVVMGTKCNKLIVLDVRTNNIVHIQSIKSSHESEPARCPCGIHSISINPSKTMLATGGENTNDLAVYELPTFDPIYVGEGAHDDWIFDLEWVDDQHVITGSRDGVVALWNIDRDKRQSDIESNSFPLYKPCTVRCSRKQKCKQADKIRALAVSHTKGLFGTLSTNASFHCWDLETFTQLDSIQLPWKRENVCVTSSDDLGLFAIGSQSYVTTIDHRDRGKNSWFPIPSSQRDIGIRSLSFNTNMITIGTGSGQILFYDVRNRQFLTNEGGKHCELMVGRGWLCDGFQNASITSTTPLGLDDTALQISVSALSKMIGDSTVVLLCPVTDCKWNCTSALQPVSAPKLLTTAFVRSRS